MLHTADGFSVWQYDTWPVALRTTDEKVGWNNGATTTRMQCLAEQMSRFDTGSSDFRSRSGLHVKPDACP